MKSAQSCAALAVSAHHIVRSQHLYVHLLMFSLASIVWQAQQWVRWLPAWTLRTPSRRSKPHRSVLNPRTTKSCWSW